MDKERLLSALRDIGLALNVTHNTVTTDVVGVEPTDTSWRVDHSRELALLGEIEKAIVGSDTCPVCGASLQKGDVSNQIREGYKLTDTEYDTLKFAGKVIEDPTWTDPDRPGGI